LLSFAHAVAKYMTVSAGMCLKSNFASSNRRWTTLGQFTY
jgi:hypothetical protein